MEKFIIDDRIFDVKFSCDLHQCKGACCTLKGAGGAPILDAEILKIKSSLSAAKKYLDKKNLDILENEGFYYGFKGDYALNNVDDEDCVFSFHEDGVTKCSFQKAYNENEINFKKPISCHLFPVRVYGNKRNIIRYEEISECDAALLKGKEENISLFEFAEDSLVREFGRNFYDDLKEKFLRRS
ncbi:MAG: DUF3109 family protein [Bacteroidota bacterium]|nr:DUF3109 family protein [Bacteroidota bacterium]